MLNLMVEMSRTLGRIEAGQHAMQREQIEQREDMRAMRRRLERIERKPKGALLEQAIKRGMTWLLPLITLWATGSIDAALKVLSALK